MAEKLNAKFTEARGCLWGTEVQIVVPKVLRPPQLGEGWSCVPRLLSGKEMTQMSLWVA